MALTYFALVMLVAATLPVFVRSLLPPLPGRPDALTPGAVVVLGAGRRRQKQGYALTTRSVRRLKLAMETALEKGLPLLVSGGQKGTQDSDQPSEASLMASLALQQWPQLTVIEETASRNTWENARYSARLLALRGVDQVILVSDRSHLPRALLCFHRQGVQSLAAWSRRLPEKAWLPSAGALFLVPEIWYEWLALLWYQLRYFSS